MTRSRPRGFTLVELLVVIGIIAVIAAFLLPAVYSSVVKARNTRMVLEIKELEKAINTYKQDKGDYPPNFRDFQVFLRHVRQCYPRINPTHLNNFIGVVWQDPNNNTPYSLVNQPPLTVYPTIDEGEALVFWLSMTTADPQYPFDFDTRPRKVYFDFKQDRLANTDGDLFPIFLPTDGEEAGYVYIDSRSYGYFTQFNSSSSDYEYRGAYAEDWPNNFTRPYLNGATVGGTTPAEGMNPSTFQIICAGQDGEFGADWIDPPPQIKQYPNALYYQDADKDNITNFSDGKTLADAMP